jgi:hypothetical protein
MPDTCVLADGASRTIITYIEYNLLPTYVHNVFLEYVDYNQNQRVRNPQAYRLPRNRSSKFSKSTVSSAIKQWDTIPSDIKM